MSMITPSVNSTKRKIYRTKMRAKEELIGALRQMVEKLQSRDRTEMAKRYQSETVSVFFVHYPLEIFFSSRIYHLVAFLYFVFLAHCKNDSVS